MEKIRQQSILKSSRTESDEIFVHQLLRSIGVQFAERTALIYAGTRIFFSIL